MQKESYWDYMARRRREERLENSKWGALQTKTLENLLHRIEELEHKVILLGGDPKQLELKI